MNKRSRIRTSVVAAMLALGMAGSALAQDEWHGHRDRYSRHDQDGPRYSQRYDRDHDQDGPRYSQRYERDHHYSQRGRWEARDDHRRWEERRAWRRGGYLPPVYRGHYQEVGDWRAHRLQAPPSGYHWVSANGDLVLAAIATGLIAHIIASN
jgi:Ni/Co efflux regulator RcnB